MVREDQAEWLPCNVDQGVVNALVHSDVPQQVSDAYYVNSLG